MKRFWLHPVVLLAVFFFSVAAAAQAEDPFIHRGCITITYPLDVDTVSYSRLRLAGNISDSGRVWINGEEVHVYPSRAFVALVPLRPGDNVIEIVGQTASARDTLRMPVYRIPPKPELPEVPTVITGDFISPAHDVIYYLPAPLYLRFRGSPGGKAEARISGLNKHIPMVEAPPEQGMGMRGVYETVYRLPAGKKVERKQIEFRLRGKDGKTRKFKTRARISVLSSGTDVVGRTLDEENLIYTRPGGTLLMPLPSGIRLVVVADLGRYYRIRLDGALDGFIRKNQLELLPRGTLPASARIGSVRIWHDRDWVHADLRISDRCPFQVEQLLDPPELVVTLFGAAQTSQWMTYPHPNRWLDIAYWRQVATSRYQFVLRLRQDHWGYKMQYVNRVLRISFRKAPRLGENPFANVTIAVDAGHGGEELGAVGATGLMEKDVNLEYASYLRDLLEQAGAKAFLTRTKDTTMTLRDRIRIAEERGAHIFVWCHNNSIGPSSDPVAVKGTSTYYTQPMGKRLAELTLPHLLDLGLPNFGEIEALFTVTRQTGMVSFLIEGAFISNPEEEMLLMDDGFLHRLANAVFYGIRDFLQEEKARQAKEEELSR